MEGKESVLLKKAIKLLSRVATTAEIAANDKLSMKAMSQQSLLEIKTNIEMQEKFRAGIMLSDIINIKGYITDIKKGKDKELIFEYESGGIKKKVTVDTFQYPEFYLEHPEILAHTKVESYVKIPSGLFIDSYSEAVNINPYMWFAFKDSFLEITSIRACSYSSTMECLEGQGSANIHIQAKYLSPLREASGDFLIKALSIKDHRVLLVEFNIGDWLAKLYVMPSAHD